MDIHKYPSKFLLAYLPCLIVLLNTIDQSLSSRTLNVAPPPRNRHGNHHGNHHHHHRRPSITFYMPNVLNTTNPSPTPATTKVNGGQLLPFSKPLGSIFPPIGGIPLPTSTIPTSTSAQTLDLPGIGITIPDTAILQEELELGTVTPIETELLQSPPSAGFLSQLVVGKAKGMYVASSEDGASQMMAMTTSFLAENDSKDGLRFFGLHISDVRSESHVAVIGGTGKYYGANGYATIKTVKSDTSKHVVDSGFLRFNVYLG